MSFETEMDQFFARNCFFAAERKKVRASRPYQLAAERNDVIQAQEIAMRVLDGKPDPSPDPFAAS